MFFIKKKFRDYFCRLNSKVNLSYLLNSKSRIQLRVLIIHSINEEEKLLNLLKNLNKKWRFITPDQFFQILDNKKTINQSSLLITFDDGFKDNLNILPILDKFSISALFFVCPGLVQLQNSNTLFPLLAKKLFRIPLIDKDIELLNWDDLRYIQDRGHSIGNHSLLHYQVNKLSIKELKEDINLSKSLLEENLKKSKSLESFSYPFGGAEHINAVSLQLLAENFKYVFSGIRGNNNINKANIIYRDEVSINDDIEITNSFLKGSFDLYYRFKLIKLIF